jgi:hypothetical protein
MHGNVDLARQQRLLDLFGKEALAAGVGERPILDAVAGGLDRADLERQPSPAVRRLEALAHLMRLRQRQRRSTRADSDLGCLHEKLLRC